MATVILKENTVQLLILSHGVRRQTEYQFIIAYDSPITVMAALMRVSATAPHNNDSHSQPSK